MSLKHLSFRVKITVGFAGILVLLVVGLGTCVFATIKISTMMEVSNQANRLVQEMLRARQQEKDYLIYKKAEAVPGVTERIVKSAELIAQIESKTADKSLLSGLTQASDLVHEYQQSFNQIVENTNKIEKLKSDMKLASEVLFQTIDKRIREPIVEAQNMALVTGAALNPALEEISKVVDQLLMDLKDARLYENAFALYQDPQYVAKFGQKLNGRKKIEEDLDYLMAQANDDALKGAYEIIQQQFEIYNGDTFNKVYSLWEANSKITESMENTGARISDIIQEFQRRAEHEMVAAKNLSIRLAILLMVSGVISGLLLSCFIVRSTTKPIARVIEELNEGAEQVSSASAQISSASQSLAEGTSRQAASLEETSSFLEQMASMTRQNADNARQADNLMKEANRVVDKANGSMRQLTVSMEEISKASEETSNIVRSIDEIAFQTNLLALNAAVEAARAGESGAGFAVVADEVRNLAVRAADAAKNTEILIEGTVKKVMDGSVLVTATDEAFAEVAKSALKVGGLVGEIASASNEQAQGIERVNRAVADIDKVVQAAAASAEECASASEEMGARAEQMKGSVRGLETVVGTGRANQRKGSEPFPQDKGLSMIHDRSLADPVLGMVPGDEHVDRRNDEEGE